MFYFLFAICQNAPSGYSYAFAQCDAITQSQATNLYAISQFQAVNPYSHAQFYIVAYFDRLPYAYSRRKPGVYARDAGDQWGLRVAMLVDDNSWRDNMAGYKDFFRLPGNR